MLPAADGDRHFLPAQFRIRIARETWEMRACRLLRRAVFCGEQGIFERDDTDDVDADSTTLAAVSCIAGIADQVVGTVRIHEAAASVWFGSRLAVDRRFRRFAGIGSGLIRLAVGTGCTRGCHVFQAHVQEANVALFEGLHWRRLHSLLLHGRPHLLMQADLAHYPPLSAEIACVPTWRQAA